MIKKLIDLIFKYANIVRQEDIQLDDNTDLIFDLGYDSLSIIQLVVELEQEFEIEINDISTLYKYEALKRYVMCHASYKMYYEEYIGIRNVSRINKFNICISKYRELPINKKYLYSVIMSKYQGTYWLSCSEKTRENLVNYMNDLRETEGIDYYVQCLKIENMKTRKMYRMIQDRIDEVRLELRPEVEYLYIEEANKYVAKLNGKIVSYCKISDIQEGFGNIVVFTEKDYRHQGFATILIKLLLLKCEEKHIFPLYVVDSKNKESIKLAEKLGFSIVNEEVIISREIE